MNTLKLFTLVKLEDGTEARVPFPNNVEQAEISTYEYTASRMGGAPYITAKIKHSLCLDNLWTGKQYVEFRGCKYFVRDTPSSSKDNNDTRYEHDITFLHERFVLENVYMLDSVFTDEDNPEAQPETDKYVSSSTKVIFWGDINEFVGRFNACLYAAGLGGSEKSGGFYVVVDEGVTSEELLVSFEDKFFSEALQEIFNTFKLPYYWEGRCCHIGLAPDELAEVFEYGAENSLLSIEKQNTNQGYCNRATGVGSSDNIPYYYPNVEAPDVTVPHAVEGNKGITDDTQLSLVADEKARERWNDMESVTDEEFPWENRGLMCVGGGEVKMLDTYSIEGMPSYYHPNPSNNGSSAILNDLHPSSLRFEYDKVESICGKTDMYYSTEIRAKKENEQEWVRAYNAYFAYFFGYSMPTDWDFFRKYGQYFYNVRGILKYLAITFPFKCTSQKGGVRMEFNINLTYHNRAGAGNNNLVEPLFKPQQLLSFFDAYIVDYNGYKVNDLFYLDVIEIETGIKNDGTFKVVVDVFDIVQDTNSIYGVCIEVKNETAFTDKALYGEGELSFALYDIQIDNPKVSPCPYRWYKEPLTNVNQLSYHRDLSYFGVQTLQQPKNGDRIVRLFRKAIGGKIVPVCTTLMPTIYRDTHGKNSFYNALNEERLVVDEEYKDYDEFYKDKDNAYIEFEHEFVADNQRETKYTFDNIKPTIKDMVSTSIVDGINVPMNAFLDVAYDSSDNDFLNVDNEKNEAKYAHSYFFVKLPKTTTNTGGTERNFNLFACADENGNDMLFSITSGSCGGCSFKVMVDEETKSKNPVLVDAAGNLLRDENGNVLLVGNKNASGYTYQNRQQHTDINEVWVALEKETKTYGVIMPNTSSHLRVVKNDTFVILNIHLPLAYILDAEDRLSKAIVEQMKKDNSERFSFNISLSRIYLEENPVIARSLTENSKIFVRYNGVTIPLYVNNYSFKMSSDTSLPEISVDLNDEISIGKTYAQNKQGGISEPISSIMGGTVSPLPIITSTDKETNPSDANIYSALATITKFLCKNEEDWATALQHFLKGIEVSGGVVTDGISVGDQMQGFVGLLKGVSIRNNGDIYARNLYLEEGLVVPSIKFNRIMGILGYFIISIAGGKIKDIEKDFLTNEEGQPLFQVVDENGFLIFDENGIPVSTTENTGYTLYANSGWATLNLESGEAGTVAVGDMLIGFWHDLYDNSRENSDGKVVDGKFVRNGDITLKGFQTIYFYVDKLDESSNNNGRFHYILRCQQDTTWTQSCHPQPEMDFFGFGNQIDKERQSVYIMSREYSLRLVNKNWWTYNCDNVIGVNGKLDGFAMRAKNRDGQEYIKWFSGYGRVGGNEYIFGSLDQFERVAYRMEINQSLGGSIAPRETELVSVRILSAYGEDVTERFTRMSVTRTTGDEASDAVWNAEHTQVSNPFEIGFNDLGIDGIHKTLATFYVTATDETNDDEANAAFDYFS